MNGLNQKILFQVYHSVHAHLFIFGTQEMMGYLTASFECPHLDTSNDEQKLSHFVCKIYVIEILKHLML